MARRSLGLFSQLPLRAAPPGLAAVLMALVVLAAPAMADEKEQRAQVEFFEQKIRPVLVEHCYECHSSQSQKLQGKLLLDSREGLRKGGESGPAVVAGDPDASLLIQALRYESYEMPPKGKLPAAVIADFEQWIKAGAIDPRHSPPIAVAAAPSEIDFAQGRQHWAFQPVVRPPLPAIASAQARIETPLDRFVVARLAAAGLAQSPAADRRTWLRRITYDLTGLPPAPEEIAAFEGDARPDAAERVVDRLLASPHYGERVARLWLDLARYAEDQAHIVGKDESLFYPNAFLYRDWLIGALNRDLPYDEFVRLQLAADLVEGEDSPNLAALGFIGLGPKYYSRRSLQVMSDEWEDRVDIVGRGLLGLTVACARCHDHKYDPIGTEDYYALAGVFASTQMFNRPLTPEAAQADERDKDNKEFENGKKAAGEAKDPKQALHIVREGTPTDLNIFIRGNVENKGPLVRRHFLRVLCPGEPQPFTSGSGRLELARAIASRDNPLTARVIVNRVFGLYFGRPLVSTASNFGLLGERPTHPELLDDLAARFMDRGWSLKALTRELVLSATYGQTSQPVAGGPAVAAGSGAIGQQQAQSLAPDNRLLWRMNRRRLSVEQWRDSLLAATARLESTLGGPSLDPQNPAERRRTVYSRASRLELNKLLAMFDYPDPNVHSDRRVETTTPLQKMFVLNSPFMVELAAGLADRLLTEIPVAQNADSQDLAAADRQRIERAYWLLYGRPAGEREIRLGLAFLERKAREAASAFPDNSTHDGPAALASGSGRGAAPLDPWTQYAQVLLAANELLYVD